MDRKIIKEIITNFSEETYKIGEKLAEEIKEKKFQSRFKKSAIVISLEGDLGSGKTTFTKGFGHGLGVKEMIKSPTFVIMKKYNFIYPKLKASQAYFYHFDCYRISNPTEVLSFGWKDMISDLGNVVIIEWGNNIKRILPDRYMQIKFMAIDGNKRKIELRSI